MLLRGGHSDPETDAVAQPTQSDRKREKIKRGEQLAHRGPLVCRSLSLPAQLEAEGASSAGEPGKG